jgi:hypothetical protein
MTCRINRKKNSREDTIHVLEEASFDILVLYTLVIGARSTGDGVEGQQTLFLRVRSKTPGGSIVEVEIAN